MRNEFERLSAPRTIQDRRAFDFGVSAGDPESRIVTERRLHNVDLITCSDWVAYKTLLGTYQTAIDKSFLEIFGSP